MPKLPELTQARLRELFEYNPQTGLFTRRVTAGNNVAGTVVGAINRDGRRQIGVDGRLYLSSRLVWLYVHGHWPTADMDHINRVRDDDRLVNLREATRKQNIANQTKRRGCTSQYRGVHLHKKDNRWWARIYINGRTRSLGYYTDEIEAAKAYDQAAKKAFGSFAGLNFPMEA